MLIKKVASFGSVVALMLLISLAGTTPVLATAQEVECAPCHGDAHHPGEDNPHGYTTTGETNEPASSNPAATQREVDCSPCHGDAHHSGEDNPHGYSTSATTNNDAVVDSVDSDNHATNTHEPAAVVTSNGYNPPDDNLTLDTIDAAIMTESTTRLGSLEEEVFSLQSSIDSDETYFEDETQTKIETLSNNLKNELTFYSVTMKEYALRYAELVMASEMPVNEKYETIDSLYRLICQYSYNEITTSCNTITNTVADLAESAGINDYVAKAYLLKYETTYQLLQLIEDVSNFWANNLVAYKYDNKDALQTTIEEFKESIDEEKQILDLPYDSDSITKTTTSDSSSKMASDTEENPSPEASSQQPKIDVIASHEQDGFLIPFSIDIDQITPEENGSRIEFSNGNTAMVFTNQLDPAFSLSDYAEALVSSMQESLESVTGPQDISVKNAKKALCVVGDDPIGINCIAFIEKNDGSMWQINLAAGSRSHDLLDTLTASCASIEVLS